MCLFACLFYSSYKEEGGKVQKFDHLVDLVWTAKIILTSHFKWDVRIILNNICLFASLFVWLLLFGA